MFYTVYEGLGLALLHVNEASHLINIMLEAKSDFVLGQMFSSAIAGWFNS